jgi:hypothetical protein
MSTDDDLPDLGLVLGSVLQRVADDQRPLLIALAERRAAERYRSWAGEVGDPARTRLLACAAREEEIAGLVEALYPEAEEVQRDLLAKHPDLDELNRSLFAGRPLAQQFTLQARGERLGAATWRALAGAEAAAERREVLLRCATLEEESAAVLESLLRKG